MKSVIATQEMLESLIDSSVSRAVKNAYIQKENERQKRLENSSSDSEEKKEEDEKEVNEIEQKRIGKGD